MTSVTRSSQTESLGHDELRKALFTGAQHLQANYQILDRLNVFPVPDGDTGSNMIVTYRAGINAITDVETRSIQEISRQMTPALLKESRGNSGFILARFFTGFFEAAAPHDRLSSSVISEGFANGSYHVATSLYSPVEGTAVTIIAAMTEAIGSSIDRSPAESLRHAIACAREVLGRTPDMLPVLARAGVVDSGALGFIMLMEGILSGITDAPLPVESEGRYRFEPTGGAKSMATGESGQRGQDSAAEPEFFRYCTEIVVSGFSGMSQVDLREYLSARGNSIALVVDKDLLKLHIHTDNPTELVEHLGSMGTIEKSKIEDMLQQMRLVAAGSEPDDTCEVLAIVPGEGFVRLFADLGVRDTIVYTEALPSAGEIQAKLESMTAGHVLILPNNNNILPAAMIARDQSNKDVSILPTSHVIQGLSACYGFSENCGLAENLTGMRDCLSLAETLFVYLAASTTRYDQTEIRSGEVFAVAGDRIVKTGPELIEVVSEALSQFDLDQRGNLTLFQGAAAQQGEIQALRDALRARFPALEIELFHGGQKRELVIVSVE